MTNFDDLEPLAQSVLEGIITRFIHNPYAIIGYGEGGLAYQNMSLPPLSQALSQAQIRIKQRARLQNLTLIASYNVWRDMLKSGAFERIGRDVGDINVDIYISAQGVDIAIIESVLDSIISTLPTSVVSVYKNCRF
ncbi:hypothetical protein LS71_001170 [Helicobacter jaachi]|uniref:Uncharacterized protein n=1 Tax=Helicobacter jaachi TaxID=1677920 RepID=A0A4V6I2T8_9HELI|nr:hypothetical protein [Helicobacter jaachi]TLD97392.1 hypothetical protein LS71_001170 [Helicobacter jaachi]